jgi:hypothetical protein
METKCMRGKKNTKMAILIKKNATGKQKYIIK